MLSDAFASLSRTYPQASQMNVRSLSWRSSFVQPHLEQSLEVAWKRGTVKTLVPYQPHLCSICLRNSLMEASATALASFRFFIMPDTFRSSRAITDGLVAGGLVLATISEVVLPIAPERIRDMRQCRLDIFFLVP